MKRFAAGFICGLAAAYYGFWLALYWHFTRGAK